MADVVLITGGSRSGKSALAQAMAEALPRPRVFVATYPGEDDAEMAARVRRHQTARAAGGWTTVEEPLDVAGVLRRSTGGTYVVDCLSLWVSNLMWRTALRAAGEVAGSGQAGLPATTSELPCQSVAESVTEDDIGAACRSLIAACGRIGGTVVYVTNEVGLGVVPDNAVARQYRDLLGRCNQAMGATADVVVLVVCGIPLVIKGSQHPLGVLALRVASRPPSADHPSC